MQQISPIKQRILQYLDFKGISKYKFYQDSGITRGVLDKESGISEENIAKFIAYASEINLLWLMTGNGEMTKPNIQEKWSNESTTKKTTLSEETKNIKNVVNSVLEPQKIYNSTPKVVTVDKHGNDNIVLVPVKAAAGYLRGYGDAEFIEKLPTYSLPNISNGTFRMFQVKGHSMHPTLMDKSFVVGEWVENWVKSVKDNRVYVIVCDEGVLVKRVLNRLKKYGNLYLKSDNRKEYPNIAIEPERIFEVWEVKMHIGTELPDPAVMYDRMNDMEADLEYIKSLLKGKN